MKKRMVISFVISVAMLLMLLPSGWKGTEVQAASHSVDEAMAWCESLLNQKVGSGQCVAFVQAYYSYLGATPSSGHAYQYSTNALPSGWSRVQGGVPQRGDILVYTGATYGHVAIYAGGTVSYHQNMSGQYVEKKTNWNYDKSWYSTAEGGTKSYWGYIRPDFGSNPTNSTNTTRPTIPPDPRHDPIGVLDSVEVSENMIIIKGWAFDYDNTEANIDVHAYIDDGLGGQIGIGSTTANKGRPDVNDAYPGVGVCHGFEAAFGSPHKGTFNVYVYAMNNVGEGSQQLIGQRQVTVNVLKTPEQFLGCCENITVEGNMLRISGWSFDGRHLSDKIVIHVYIDSASGAGTEIIAGFGAADSRVDVLNEYGVEYCGFNYLCDATRTGTFNVYVYAISYNVEVQLIHTQQVTVTQSATTPTTVNMAANKSVFSPGEEIKFDFSANNYPTKFNLYIDDKDSGSNVLTKEITTITDGNKGQYKIATLNPGRYSAYVVASNRAGSLKSNVITLKVSEPFTPVATLTDNGHTYVLYDDLLTWTEAKNKCEELGGHLVTITSEHEQNLICSFFTNTYRASYWIGASDEEEEGTFKWVTGEAFDYANWRNEEPNNYGGDEDYVNIYSDGIYASYLGKWNDATGQKDTEGFILEIDPSYTITYNANGGKNAPSAQTKTHGKNLTLSSTEPTRDNYTFLGWSENKNATTATYTSGAVFSEDKDVTLYAIWQENASTYTPGDINGDGLVNNKDLTRLMKYIAGENVEVVEAALDVNGDGTVNNKDLTRLMKYLAGADVTIN